MRAGARIIAIGNLYPPAARGGYERIFAASVDALQERGHEVEVLTTAPVPGAELPPDPPEQPHVHRALRWWWRDHEFTRLSWRAILALERHNAAVLARHLSPRPDVVCWWGMGGMSLSLLEQVSRRGIPAVGVVADRWMEYGFAVDRWLRLARLLGPLAPVAARRAGVPARVDLARAARWIFISRYVAEMSPRVPRAEVVPPGVDHRRLRQAPPRSWSWRLACVGRVEPRKGIGVAIDALRSLPTGATLVVDGHGPPEYLAQLGRHAAGMRVRFCCSATTAVADTYAGADAVLFPVTWDEPWGLVPLEAMAVGRPVVATATGGSTEYLRDGENALVVPPGDPLALAAAVRRLAADETLRERLRRGGLATAARYDQTVFTAKVVEALEQEARMPTRTR